jgi:hypothetical protein
VQPPRRIALALAALAALASCDSAPPLDSEHLPPDGAVLATAPFPAPANFTAVGPGAWPDPNRSVTLSWEDVPGDYGYLVQWRKGEAGTWKSLVSTGANRTTFVTDSFSLSQPNYYRVAVFTTDFRAGAYSTVLLGPRVFTQPAALAADSLADLKAILHTNGSPASFWFEWGADSLLAGAAQTPVRPVGATQGNVSERVTVVPGTTYYFRAVTSNAGGTSQGAIRRFNAGAPDAPTGVTATFSAAPRQITTHSFSAAHHVYLQYTHDGNDVATFRPQRRLLGSANWVELPEFAYPRPRSHVDQTFPVTSNREYDYRVLACNARGQCAASAETRVTTQGLPAPTGFKATRAADGRVVLAWQDLPTEESYTVQWRAGETGNWQQLLSTSKNVTSHTTDRVTAGVTNYYRVAGEVKTFRGGAFSVDSVAPGAGRSMQLQTGSFTLPSGASASMSGVVTPNGLPAMAWIEWGTDPSLAGASATPASPVGSGISAVTFADTVAVTPGHTYYYRAAASNSLGTLRGAIKSFHAGPPSAPGLTAAFDLPTYRIVVTPTHDGGGTPTQFRIERRATGQTAWTLVRTQNTSTPFVFTESPFPANAARSFDYRAHACNAAAECTTSVIRTVQTQPLAAPAGLTAVPEANGRVTVSWQDITGEVAYLLQWRTDPAGPWKHVVSTGTNSTRYTSSSITPGTTNYYRVAGEASGFRQGLFSEISIVAP